MGCNVVSFVSVKIIIQCCLTLACAVVLYGCSEQTTFGSAIDHSLPLLSVSQAIESGRLGKTLRIVGTIEQICQDEGCWVTVTDGTEGLRISFEGSAFVVPTDLTGDVYVQGKVLEEVYPAEDARELAESLGWSDDRIASISGDTRIPVMLATGLEIVRK